jgi:capsular exopolysaccharide synthesis family protein
VLRGTHTFEQAVRVFQLGDDAALHVLTTGELPPNPAALLGSDEMTALLRRAETAYEVVIIDSPPVNVVSDAAVLAANAQGVVLVARAGRTARRALEFAAEQLRMVRAPLVGAILNDIDFKRDAAYDGSYRYYGDPALYRLDDAAAWAPSGA